MLQALLGVGVAGALGGTLGRNLLAAPSGDLARRFIVFYFPDGVPGPSEDGSPSLWHPTGGETSFSLPDVLSALEPWREQCVFLNGLSMGPTDSGSHPGGMKKLLTGVDGGNGRSIDQHLAATVGSNAPFRHLYLGAMANQNNASGDKHLSYPTAGASTPPQDSPLAAFETLFGAALPAPQPGGAGGSGGSPGGSSPQARTASVLDTALTDLDELRAKLGSTEKSKLDLHLESLREVERRVDGLPAAGGGSGGTTGPAPSCDEPYVDTQGIASSNLYDPALFPRVLRAQTDVMVQAMACGLTQVGVLQASHHTSELIMSRFPGTEMHDPSYDMRSHQASHYGASHDFGKRELSDFVKQRRWFVQQFAYLLEQLAARPEGDGSMLDYSLVLLCTEVSDGNTHSHDQMPFVLAGGASGAVRTGRLLDLGYHRHADLLVGIAHALGDPLDSFGDASSGPLPGLLA